MTIEVTQCENCPFVTEITNANDGDSVVGCNRLPDYNDRFKGEGTPRNCPLLTSDINVTLKQ